METVFFFQEVHFMLLCCNMQHLSSKEGWRELWPPQEEGGGYIFQTRINSYLKFFFFFGGGVQF